MPTDLKEVDLAAPLGPWLTQHGWEAYPEVELAKMEPIADWVATKGELVAVFECKTTFSLKLLRQAHYWCDKADRVSIVLPPPSNKSQREERIKSHDMMRTLGIGLIEIDADGKVEVVLNAGPQTPGRSDRIRNLLNRGHQRLGEAGTAGGKRWSPYQQTMADIRGYVKYNPGCTIKEAVRNVQHHWPTNQKAIHNLVKFASMESGLPGIRTEAVDGLLRLYVKESEEAA